MQAAFKRLYKRAPRSLRSVYSGPIDGRTNSFNAVLLSFLHSNFGKLHPGGGSYERVVKPDGPYLKLINKLLSGDSILNVRGIPGSAVLYVPGAAAKAKPESGRDYLIPESLHAPLERKLNLLPVSFAYRDVKLLATGKLEAKIYFPHIKVLDPQTLQASTNLGTLSRAFLKKELSGTPWDIQAAQTSSDYITLLTKQNTGLWKTIEKLDQNGGVSRVFASGEGEVYGINIPKKQELLKVVGRIAAERCAASGEKGGAPLPEESAESKKIVNEILKIAPPGFKERIYTRCRSCEELGNDMFDIDQANKEFVYVLDDLALSFQNFIANETSVRKYEADAEDTLKKAATAVLDLTPIPVDGGALVDGQPKVSSSSAVNATSKLIQADADRLRSSGFITKEQFDRMGQGADNVKILGKLLIVWDFIQAIDAAGKLLVDTPKYLSDLELIKKEFVSLQRNVNNVFAEFDGKDFRRVQYARDFEARKCGWVFYGYKQALTKIEKLDGLKKGYQAN